MTAPITSAPDRPSEQGARAVPPAARSRRGVLLLALVFLGPLLLSSWLYYGSNWRPTGHTNHGLLIEPARALPDPLLHGKWSLIYIGSGDCAAECQQALYYMRQTHLGLGQHASRVQRLFLVDRHCCGDRSALERSYPGLITRDEESPQGAALLGTFPAAARGRTIFVVDPRGNLMMRYDLRAPPQGLLEDLKHLLQLSSIG